MPEGRMLKKRISDSKKLGNLSSDSARLLYTWLIPHLDVEGRYSADPELIKGHIFPKIKSMTINKIEKLLNELDSIELIVLYKWNDERFLQLLQFHDYQNICKDRESPSKIPAPTEETLITHENSRVTHENSLLIKVKESKVKGKVNNTAQSKKVSSEQSPINFNPETQKWENITEKDMQLWREAYPACKIEIELKRMIDWLVRNPKKRKKQYGRFISSWLSRQQDRGGTKGIKDNTADEWAEKKQAEMEKNK